MDKELRRQLFELIADDRIGEAVDALQESLPMDHPDYINVILLARRLRELERDSQNALVAMDDASRARNQISNSLLELLRNLTEAPPSPAPPPPSPPPNPPPRTAPSAGPPPAYTNDPREMGFFGEVEYSGSYCAKRETIELPDPYGMAYHKCLRAIAAAGMEMQMGDRSGGRIQAKVSGNYITSFGEEVYLWLTPVNPGRTRVTVVVDCLLKTTVMDWGRCKNKLNALLSQLR